MATSKKSVNGKVVNKNSMPWVWIAVVIAVIVVVVIVIMATRSSPISNTTNSTPIVPVPGASTVNIKILDYTFIPVQTVIKAGDTVVWTNKDTVIHSLVSDTGSELNSGNLANGQTYSHTFTTAGTYNYHCTIHTMMKAKVIVQ